jgi:gliding motility-associated-like protein
MNRILTLVLLFTAATVFGQQKIDVSDSNYDQLKAQGQLEGLQVVASSKAGVDAGDIIVTPTMAGGGGQSLCDCWLDPDDTYTLAMAPNDDGSSAQISMDFDFCLYGEDYSSVYINNNGNISFGSPYATFSAEGFPSTNYIMVAPFWGDVDTRPANGGEVWYKLTETALYVNWVEVGYYNQHTDKLNSFQVIITNGGDPVVPDGNNISFCYLDMQWTTGDASQGSGGFGGVPATVGANLGDGTSFIQFGRFDQAGAAFDGPFGESDGIDWLDNKYFILNTCVDGNNIAPFSASSSGVCDTLVVCQGGATTLVFLGPEEDQLIDITYESDGGDDITVSSSGQSGSTDVFVGVTEDIPPGTYLITITATDNGTPALSTSVFVFIEVIEDNSPPVEIMGPEGLCQGQTGVLTVEDVYTSYQWNTGSLTSTTNIPGPGIYTIIAQNDICLKFDEYEVLALPTPDPIIEGQILICDNAETTLTLTEDYASYNWGGLGSGPSISVGQGNYSVTVVNDEGCSGTTSIVVGALPVPTLPADQDICGLEFEVSGIVPNFNGLWTQDFTTEHNASFDPVDEINTMIEVNDLGVYDFVFTDECGITADMSLNFFPIPDFTFEGQEICAGDPLIIAPSGLYPEYFDWEWNDGSQTYFTEFGVTGFYTYEASNQCGTQLDSAEFVAIACEISIPNVFSPNADAWNNAFYIEGMGSFPGSQLQVFNRWGKMVFDSPSYNNTWDAVDVAQGTYYYILDLRLPSGKIEKYSGNVTILKD